MGAINVKIPDEMEKQMDEFVEETGQYINRSELVRDALRRRIEQTSRPELETLELTGQSKQDMREDALRYALSGDQSEQDMPEGRTRSVDEVRECLEDRYDL